jgi:hypothetical protein
MERRSVWYSIKQWRKERTFAHEGGHSTPELCYPGEKDGHFQSPEIVVFQNPIDLNPYEEEQVRLYEVRKALDGERNKTGE